MSASKPHTKQVTVEPFGSRTLHFHSKWAGRLGGTGNCVTPNATDIYVSTDRINRATLAHEFGHGEDAERLGWRYLPWVAWCYVTQGYLRSNAELSADRFMAAHHLSFPIEVRCDDD